MTQLKSGQMNQIFLLSVGVTSLKLSQRLKSLEEILVLLWEVKPSQNLIHLQRFKNLKKAVIRSLKKEKPKHRKLGQHKKQMKKKENKESKMKAVVVCESTSRTIENTCTNN